MENSHQRTMRSPSPARSADATPDAPVRTADTAGPADTADPRLREQLDALNGQKLSQYSIGDGGLRLAFWGNDIAAVGREVLIEEEIVQITTTDQPARRVAGRSEYTATTLLNALDHKLTVVDVTGGRLRLVFDSNLQIEVDPHEQWEAWQISADDDLLIICTPGGELTIWYPHADN